MSIYDNYKISIANDKLIYTYNDEIFFEFDKNSNVSLVPLKTSSINSINDKLIFNSSSNIFNGNLEIKGKLDAYEFPSKVLILDGNNKIDASYLPTISSGSIYTSDLIGIGTTNPESSIHIASGDLFIQKGRIGIGTKPSFHFHLDKSDVMISQPAFVISSNNTRIIDFYTEKKEFNFNGVIKTKSLELTNDLYLSNLNSLNNQIIINSNIDLIVNNNSIKSIINKVNSNNFTNEINITNSNNELILKNNSNLFIIDSNSVIINNLLLKNYDSLTSNPNVESIFDIKGKFRTYNDTSNIINKIFINDTNLFLITNDKYYNYNLLNKSYSLISSNLNNAIIKTKINYFGYYLNSNLIINNTIVLNTEIIDYALTSSINLFYYIDKNFNLFQKNLNTITQILINNEKAIKIETYNYLNSNKFIVLTNINKLYYYDGTTLNQIIDITGTILDFATGDTHTIVLTTTGVWSFGSNYNNDKFKKGYELLTIDETTSGMINVNKINLLNDIKIIKVKAYGNSSAVIDDKGYVYIFGNINKKLNTIISKLVKLNNINDFVFNNLSIYLLTYFNDIFTLKDNNEEEILLLPNEFYGISMKSRGSIIIGGNNFYKESPRNSLLVEKYIAIGSNISLNPNKYSLEIEGNINIKSGSIYYNDILQQTTDNNSTIINPNYWNKINDNLNYLNGNIGIGIENPKEKLEINGNVLIHSNLTIKGNLITDEYKPFNINKNKDIYYIGKLGINNRQPKSTIDLYNGDIKISYNTEIISNLDLDLTSNYEFLNTKINSTYYTKIATNNNNSIIATSFYNSLDDDNNNNNSNVIIYKKINNKWISYPIRDIANGNTSFGITLSISDDGSNIFIGAPKEKDIIGISTIITGGIYHYYFNENNNLIKNSNRITEKIGTTNNYYLIGNSIKCSGNGLILVSTILYNNKLLFIKDLSLNKTNLIAFENIFHSSLNNSIAINNDGSIIIINFIYDNQSQGIPIIQFPFFNLYVIIKNTYYFIKFPSGYINTDVTNINISSDGNRILISNNLGNHFIYDINLQLFNVSILSINNIDYYYFNINPIYIINDSKNKSKLSKSGEKIYLYDTISINEYIYNYINDKWNFTKERLINNINDNYDFSIDYNGLSMNLFLIKKINETLNSDIISTKLIKYDFYKEIKSFNLNNSNLEINTDTYISCNLYVNKIIGDGSNIKNIQLQNIYNNGNNGIIYSSNNYLYDSKNFTWINNSNLLLIDGNLIVTSNIFFSSNFITESNIYTNKGSIISSSNIIAESNLITNKGSIYSGVHLYANLNLYVNSNIYASSNLRTNYDINSLYGSINAGINLNANNDIIANSNIKTIYGSILSASNLIANSNIIGLSNLIISSNISTLNGNIYSSSNIISEYDIKTNKGSIISSKDLIVEKEIITQIGSIKSSSNLIANSNIIGLSNLIITSNIITNIGFIHSANNLIANSNIIGFSNLIINSNISTINGIVYSASNIIAESNLITNKGSIISGKDIISENNIKTVIGTINSASNIIANNDIYAKYYYGDGCNLSNLKIENLTGILPINKGGLGKNNLISNLLLVGNGNDEIIQTNDLLWSNNNLIFSNNASLIISNIAPIINIPFVSNSHYAEIISITKGGTGTTNMINTSIPFISLNKLDTSYNLYWCNIQSNLFINGNIHISSNIYGIGSNITSIEPLNLIGNVPVIKGGTGSNFFNKGRLLIGNDNLGFTTNNNLNWNDTNNTLNVSNLIILNDLIIKGSNASNIDANRIINIISLSNGGLGISNINNGELLLGFNNNRIQTTSRLRWNNDTLIINSNIITSNVFSSNFYGDGNNISNLNYDNITGIISFNKGGLGFNNINKGQLLYANENNKLSNLSTVNWNNDTNTLIVNGNINCSTNISGNGFNIDNLDMNKLVGVLPINKGGTGITSIGIGKILVGHQEIGSSIRTLIQPDNLIWDQLNSRLGIGTAKPTELLHVEGTITCKQLIVGSTILSQTGEATTSLSANAITSGELRVQYGGTGLNIIETNRFLIGNNNDRIQTTNNLIWYNNTSRLGIGTFLPQKTLDIVGDINFSGIMSNNYIPVTAITAFKDSQDNSNIIYTDKQLFLGYSNNDNYKLKVNGNIYISGFMTGLSDIRFKTNINIIKNSLEKIQQINGVYYNLINDDKRSIGLIAQEVEKIIPEVVYTNTDNTKSIAYTNMVAVLIEAIKELNERIKKLEEKL